MALPEHLENLRQISIDTLGLTESEQAVLKWYGITSVMDCIVFFYLFAHRREAGRPWSRLTRLMFGEVRSIFIAKGYWALMMDAEGWRALTEWDYAPPIRRIVHWQGRDQDLNELPFEQFGIPQTGMRFKSIGGCIHYFLFSFRSDSKSWLEKLTPSDRPADKALSFHEHLFEVVRPRLEDMGLWAFVEEHIDDFDREDEAEVNWEQFDWDVWEPRKEEERPPIHVIMMQFFIMMFLMVTRGRAAMEAHLMQQGRKRS